MEAEVEILPSIQQLVEQRLQDAQKNKTYKDEGRKAGTKKEKRAYSIINIQNIGEIEDDPILAQKLVSKEKVFPEINVEEEKSGGHSSGAVYLKVQYRNALAAKPFNSKEARSIYVKVIEFFQDLLKNAKTYDQVSETAYQVFSNENLKTFVPEILTIKIKDDNSNRFRYYVGESTLIKERAAAIFGKAFLNLVRRSWDSDAAKQKILNARLFEAYPKEKENEYAAKQKEYAQKTVERYQAELAKIKAKDFDGAFAELKMYYSFVKKSDFAGKEKDVYAQIETIYERRIKQAEIIRIPALHTAREENWDWAYEKKERAASEKSDKPKINQYEFLSHIRRKGGLSVEKLNTRNVKETWKLSAVQYGNSLTDAESEKLTYFLNGALTDLEEMTKINLPKLHEAGKLGIDFATRGTAGSCATYWSDYKVINLNKRNGDGSLNHEWGHFFDNFLGSVVPEDQKVKINGHLGSFASEHGASDPEIDSLYKQLFNYIRKGDGTQFITKKVKGKEHGYKFPNKKDNFQETYEYYKGQIRKSNYPERILENIAFLFAGEEEIEYKDFIGTSFLYYSSLAMGGAYWSSSAELWARSWEMYIYSKLEEQEFISNFLQPGKQYLWGFGIYPLGDERKVINGYLDKIVEKAKSVYGLGSEKSFSGTRVDETLENSTLEGDKKLHESVVEKQEEEVKPVDKPLEDMSNKIPTYKEASKLPKGGAVAMDKYNLRATAAEMIANHQGLNPAKVYDWANKHDVDIVKFGYIFSDVKNNDAILNDILNNVYKDTKRLVEVAGKKKTDGKRNWKVTEVDASGKKTDKFFETNDEARKYYDANNNNGNAWGIAPGPDSVIDETFRYEKRNGIIYRIGNKTGDESYMGKAPEFGRLPGDDTVNNDMVIKTNGDCDNYKKAIAFAKKNSYILSKDTSKNGFIFFEKIICKGEHKIELQVYDGIINKSEPQFTLYNWNASPGESILSETTYRFEMEHDQHDFGVKDLKELFALALRKEKQLSGKCKKKKLSVDDKIALLEKNLKRDVPGSILKEWQEELAKLKEKKNRQTAHHEKTGLKPQKNADQYIADLEKQPAVLKAMGENQVIQVGLQFEKDYRSHVSQKRDESHDGKKRLSPTPENLLRWMKHPGHFDLIGVDTFQRTDQTADYKRLINRQKFWNALGIKI